jgi:hypothetical protein
MWNVNAKVTPLIAGTTETISDTLRKCQSNLPGKHEIRGLQKAIILFTAHIYLKVRTKHLKRAIILHVP